MKKRIIYLTVLTIIYIVLLCVQTNVYAQTKIPAKKHYVFNLGAYYWDFSGKSESYKDYVKRQKIINKTNKRNEKIMRNNIKKSQNKKRKC
jgi:peptidoglycan hydrolase CwlO-like protein